MKKNYTEAVAAELRAAMGREQVGPSDLAARTGMNVKTVSRTINGQRKISVEELVILSRALNVHVEAVLADAIDAAPDLAKSA